MQRPQNKIQTQTRNNHFTLNPLRHSTDSVLTASASPKLNTSTEHSCMHSCTCSISCSKTTSLITPFGDMGEANKLYIQNNAMHSTNQHCRPQNSAMKQLIPPFITSSCLTHINYNYTTAKTTQKYKMKNPTLHVSLRPLNTVLKQCKVISHNSGISLKAALTSWHFHPQPYIHL